MPRTINDFPPEVLQLVLRQVKIDAHSDRSAAFLNALLTCRQWLQISEPILWTDIALRGGQLIKFVRGPATSALLVRSLSIKVPAHYDWDVNTKSMFYDEDAVIPIPWRWLHFNDALKLLPKTLERMENLESFSFVLPELDLPGDEVWVRPELKELKEILIALPASLRHLEFDTHCLEDRDWDTQDDSDDDDMEDSDDESEAGTDEPEQERTHLCPILAEKIGCISNVRLRLGSLCHDLFNSETSKSVTVSGRNPGQTSTRPQIKNIIISAVAPIWGCGGIKPFKPCQSESNSYYHFEDNGGDATEVLRLIMSQAQSFITRCGDNEETVRLSIYDLQSAGVDHRRNNLYYEAINERVLVSGPITTTKLKKTPCYRAPEEEKSFLRYEDSNGIQKDICGKWRDIEDLAEGGVWIETREGHRLPKDYFQVQPRFDSSVLKARDIEEINEDAAQEYGSLFCLEREEGKKLLVGTETSGLKGVGALKRGLTRREMEHAAHLQQHGIAPAIVQRASTGDGGISIPFRYENEKWETV
ncbi:hypothetical protein H2200_013297 [Cladophialophora chaetospira]|uniref:F-box domain-containing protein n=1 Tax=Cladophialophora chaetospira TaxID=386627 RepID=A0AA38WW12_9EURO|nr:hypothetical protein H2200_013297 [Cladophialophora chaetospira]